MIHSRERFVPAQERRFRSLEWLVRARAATDRATPYVAHYSGEDGGVTARYMLRWVGTTGEKGPWSETASATIGA